MSGKKEKTVKLKEITPRLADESTAREPGFILLSPADSALFTEALLDPPASNERLKQAAARHKVLIISR